MAEETAKAAQEIAKATGKAIDAGQQFGRFISKYLHGPLEQGIGIFEDRLKYMRWERQVRLMPRADELLRTLGLPGPTRAIPMKLAIPLLQGASLEDDDSLQDMWARLLVNAANADSGVDLKRVYIDILERLTPLEALLLDVMYRLPFETTQHNKIRTDGLPEIAIAGVENDATQAEWKEPNEAVKLALISLAHVGLIAPARTWGGGELYSAVNPTLLGKHFVAACTLVSRGEANLAAK